MLYLPVRRLRLVDRCERAARSSSQARVSASRDSSLVGHPPYDVVLANGSIVDGSGAAAFTADLAIKADQVVRIGDLRGTEALRRMDVSGLVVSTGFIDVHSHVDAALISSPQMTPKLTQGVTTVLSLACELARF